MNKLVSLAAAAMILLGCSNMFKDEITELHSEIDALKEQIMKINGSIDALQKIVTALESKDYVSSVTAISEDGKVVGYTLHFDKSGDVPIYHGENGHTPEISVRQDTDGQWYWTIDGEWMLTSSGDRIRATAIDGATPQLKIEEDYWYVSYDNGVTWTKLCQANYHGEDGHSPEVSVRQDTDGQWYWTIDGEWMLTDSGERIRATAIDGETPQLKIEEDYWWVSYDNGKTWTRLCQANYHGEDGHSPEVSVRQDTDGQWYWTIDGEWMLNESGEKVRAGAKDGTTPQLKIEEDYWWVSYDNGATWTKLGQANYHGEDGHTPDISVSQDIDGEWYWTIDGEWMMTDSGEKVRAGAKDGETPQLKIDEDYWWVSYDNGITWTKLCQAIYHGKDGDTPDISVRQDTDGEWYWTINGEWMLNESGEKVRAGAKDGTTPQLKIEEDYWWVSYDGGATWSRLSQANVKGDSIFENVDVRNTSYVELTLTDGTVLKVPRYSPIQILFETDENETAIGAGETISIRYRVSGGTSKLLVTVSSDGYFKTSITPSSDNSGVIKVTCPTTYVNGYINVLVSDMDQHTVVKVIKFYERKVSFNDGLTYRVGPYGGTVTVPYSYNFEHTIAFESGCDEWIKMVSTKADMLSETLQFEVAPNTLESVRVGYINILPITNSSVPYAQITIIQSSAYFTIDQSGFTVPSIGEMIEVNMTSTRGVKVDIPAEATWLSEELENEGESYKLKVKVERNYTDSDRSVEIPVYTGDGEILQGKIVIRQLSEDMDSVMDMVIEVSANEINRSTVYLPLVGECHCYVDWGDGTMDHIDKNIDANNSDQYVKHEYKEYGYYKVRIAGSVYALSSFRMPDRNAIRAVLQWGNLGLVKMEQAFLGCSSLKYVAGDTVGAFTKIKRFNESFQDCTTLDSVSEDLFSKALDATEFVNTFKNCKHLADIPEDLFYNNTKAKSFGDAFNSCSSIVSLPAGLFRRNLEVTDFTATFIYCSSLSSLPGEIFSSCPEVTSFACCFRGCYSLKIIPVSLFDNNRRVTVFYQTFCFDGNHSSQESPYTVIDGEKYHLYERWKAPDYFVAPSYYTECFYGCSFIDAIPSDW